MLDYYNKNKITDNQSVLNVKYLQVKKLVLYKKNILSDLSLVYSDTL